MSPLVAGALRAPACAIAARFGQRYSLDNHRQPNLSEEDALVVPVQELCCWPITRILWHANRLAAKSVVGATVVPLLLESWADIEPMISRNGDIAQVEESVNIATEK